MVLARWSYYTDRHLVLRPSISEIPLAICQPALGIWRLWMAASRHRVYIPVSLSDMLLSFDLTDRNCSCWGVVGTIFNFFIKRRWTGWWMQYNYVTSAALDAGLIVSTVVVFFALYMSEATPLRWFGNIEALSTLDYAGVAVQSILPPGETFGPSTWP